MGRARKVRVVIPRNPLEMIRLGSKIMAKHEQDGEKSQLRVLDMADTKEVLSFAEGEDSKGREHRQQSEHCLQNRDNAVGLQGRILAATVRHFVISARDVLLGRFKGEERALADWGFEVHFSSSPEAETPEDEERKKA